MKVRLLLGVTFVANIVVLVVCTETTQWTATSVSSANATSSSSYASSSSSAKAFVSSNPKSRRAGVCPDNERYSSCIQAECRALNCTQKDQPVPCIRLDPKFCKKGCVCKEGYLRNEDGICVLVEKCQRPITCSSNEVLDKCPTDCQSDYCPTEEDTEAKSCVMPDVCPTPVCKCAFNYRRASNGSCIPTRECPPFKCRTNEEYNPCPPLCPTDDCSEASPSGECPPLLGNIGITLPCNPECRCIKDYWRLNGICVPYGQCPGVCPDNERYSTCLQAECRALNCTQKDKSVPCVRLDPKFCKKGCVCKEGYLRNEDGICVLEEKCEPPSCISANEEFVPCMQGVCRAKNCSQKGEDVPCPDIPQEECDSGCICKENFLRAENGTCVPEDQCEPNKCPTFEQWDKCANAVCRAQFCYQKGLPVACPAVSKCEPGCLCQDGYLREESGVCVPEEDCNPPPTCGENEVLDNCSLTCNSDKCPKSADEEQMCTQSDPCVPACKCKFNYKRAENGTCIPTRDCPPFKCRTNEEYNPCPPLCPTDDCSQASPSGECPPLFGNIGIILPCNPKCRCIKDYWRRDGICVPYGECPGVCPDNERYSTCIQAECRALNCTQKDKSVPCVRLDPTFCEKGCVCEEGYLRNEDGICVLEEKCEPAPSCISVNEEFVPCMQGVCRAKNCSQKGENVPCPDIPQEECDSGCICKENFLRAENGTCVPEDQCEPNKCPPFEQWDKCANAVCRAQFCYQKGLPVGCPAVSKCEPGCLCQAGYLREESGVCVPEEDCKPPPTCGENEVLYNCSLTCNSDNCPKSADEKQVCTRSDPCVPACKCMFNYKRAENGTCIPTRNCPPFKCTTNEEYNPCPPLCPTDDCSQASPSGKCPPLFGNIGITLPCNPKCRCIKDYWRRDGICVPYGECPGVCPDNERYSTCIQAECRALNCTQKDNSVPCVRLDPTFCEKGCVCEEGYLRNEDGICVLEEKCQPPSCISIDEEFVPCMQGVCRAKNCSQKGEDVPCPDIPQEECDSGCICKENFLRAENGTCVPEDRHDKANKCPPFEQWDKCANAVCRAQFCYQKGLPVGCPAVSKCEPGCLCQAGYLREESGVCVPEEECNPPPTCGENEVLDNCSLTCNSDNCPKSADEEQMCTQSDPCVPACKCKFNYKRSENGTCIPTRDCPPFDCSAKPNEEFVACPPFCPTDECGKPRLEGRCPFKIGTFLQCNPKCQCKDGYGRVNGTCVPFEECPDLCPANEVYSSCVQQTCRPQNCTERDVAMESCPSDDATSCQRGCVCQENYYRNDKGVCVPYEECEAPKTCGENEVLDNCPMTCNSDNCPKSADEKQVCTRSDPCVPACKCRFNYKRAENGTCIPTRNCPPFDCSAKPNEEFVACPPICPSDECGKPRLEGRCPFRIGIILQCNPKCQCKDGYGRVNGTCVPFDECPNLCPANEVYSSCVQQTCRRQNCSDRDLAMKTCPTCDADSCQRGCVCQENYYRNDKGVCISYEECGGPMCPYAHEEYTPNFKECPPNTCEALVAKYACDENQKEGPGCVCEYGYLRGNVTTTCIPICDCPQMKGSPDC